MNILRELQANLFAEIIDSYTPMLTARDMILAHHLPFPKHILFIADGNARWAQQQKPPVSISEGHRKGAEAVIQLLRSCYPLVGALETITIWTISPENLIKRDPREVHALMMLNQWHLQLLHAELQETNVRFIHLGSKEELPGTLSTLLTCTEEMTKQNTGLTVALGINYNGEQEDYMLVNQAIQIGRSITKQEWLTLRDPHKLSQADLIIRAGGEQRLSKLGWIAADGELLFSSVLTPDYNPKDLAKALIDYAFRQRRGGGRS